MFSKLASIAILLAGVNAHAFLESVTLGGQSYGKGDNNTPIWAWSNDNGPAATAEDLSNPDIACHPDVTPAQNAPEVAAGSNIGFLWGQGLHKWGPFLTYAAKCDIGCDPTKADFYKIGEINIDDSGTWPVPKYTDNGKPVPATLPQSMEVS